MNRLDESLTERPFPLPPYAFRRVQVRQVIRVNRGWVRVILGGSELKDFEPCGTACWVKLFVPGPRGNVGRAYTVRAFDADKGLLEIDVVRRRQTGAISQWIYEHLKSGDELHIAGPRGGVEIDPGVQWHLLMGDETSLPAIHCLLEALPATGRKTAVIEVPFPEANYASNKDIHYLFRGVGHSAEQSYLETAMTTLPEEAGQGWVWIGGEASLVKKLRLLANERWGPGKTTINATGYWKMGLEDYRDEEVYPLGE